MYSKISRSATVSKMLPLAFGIVFSSLSAVKAVASDVPQTENATVQSVKRSVPTALNEAASASSVEVAPTFEQCLARLTDLALGDGLEQQFVASVMPSIKPVERVIELDRKQPEFTESFGDYLNKRVNDYRVEKGRELLVTHKPLLDRLTQEYGIPAQYLVAFWGLETNFGNFLGGIPTLNALATLACDTRRSAFFSTEFVAALKLMQQNKLPLAQLKGSWAGAVGHTQFMPTTYLNFAVDGDGDGVVNLWQSLPDALTSAANYLRGLGWQKELRWGREVLLPKGFPFEQTGLKTRKSLQEWQRLGVRTAHGAKIPVVKGLEGSILIPTGHNGPAFLVYQNFHVIMGWNRSESYALSVGHLADRINGIGKLKQQPDIENGRLRIEDVKKLQSKLNELGFDAGPADGILGPATRDAIRGFQLKHRLIADGFPAPDLMQRLFE